MRCNWAAKTGSYFMHGPKLAHRMMLEATTFRASRSVWFCWPPVEEYACKFPGADVFSIRHSNKTIASARGSAALERGGR